MTVADNVRRVRERVAAAAERSGRTGADVTVVAAVKYAGLQQIEEAVAAGVTHLGENRAQALAAHASHIGPGVTWHFLGEVQTNKVKLLDEASLIHSVDRRRELEALDARAEALGRSRDALIEVNLAGESSKQGVRLDEVEALLEASSAHPGVKVRGFMFMAPQAENPEDVRWMFAEGRSLRERFASYGLDELSMGMTDDFEVAIEEGSTIVRIGRAIFEPEEGS